MGYYKGFTRQLFSLLTFGGVVAMILFMLNYHNTHMHDEGYDGKNIAMWSAIIFVLFIVIMFFLSHQVKKTLEEASLGPLNKLAGVLIGVLKGSLILFAVVWFVEFMRQEIDFVHEQELKEMVMYQYINEKRISIVNEIFPKEGETVSNDTPNILDLPQD